MTAIAEAQGSLFQLRTLYAVPQKQTGGGARGKITTFSRASRKRLLKLFARMSMHKVRTSFLTLTFSASPTPLQAKQALKRFMMRIRRKYPDASGVWRMEYQRRGAIHFHIIMFNFPYFPQKKLQKVWEACTGEAQSIVHITLVRSHRGLMGYVSKYVAKLPAPGSTSLDNSTYQHDGGTGRFYGVLNAEALPYAGYARVYVEDADAERYTLWGMRALSRGKCARGKSAFLFTRDAYRMLDWLCEHITPEWYSTATLERGQRNYAVNALAHNPLPAF